jgi:3-dehydroquinate dehydratase-2
LLATILLSTYLLINGPNLNLLGSREPHLYGTRTLADIEAGLQQKASALGHNLLCFQSNHEGALIDRVHAARQDGVSALIINAGAYTHTSIALRDALSGVALPFIEVHLSNVYARESFRHHSQLSAIAKGVIVGLGAEGYVAALHALHQMSMGGLTAPQSRAAPGTGIGP